jgi:hypothetical protein
MIKLLLVGVLITQASPAQTMAECEPFAEPLKHLSDRAAARLIKAPRIPFPIHRPPEVEGCAVIVFTLTTAGERKQLRGLAASSDRAGRRAVRWIGQTRYSSGEEEDAAFIIQFRGRDN